MKKNCIVIAVAVMSVVSVFAQNYDPGVLAEVIQSTPAGSGMETLLHDPVADSNYQVVAVEDALAREAGKRGLDEKMDVQNRIQQLRRKILVQALRDDLYQQVQMPTDAELQAIYNDNPNWWLVPEGYQLDAFVLDPDNEVLMKEAKKLTKEKSVSDDQLIALNISPVATQASGRWMTTNDIVDVAIWKALDGMKEGSVTVFTSDPSIYLIRRGAKREAYTLQFGDVKDYLSEQIRLARTDSAWRDLIQETRMKLGFDLETE